MIQFKRGKSSSWNSQKIPLADGQPGYDKDRHKIKIGDGKSSWDSLPNASGMTAEEILDSEKNAKTKAEAIAALNPIGSFIAKALKIEDRTVITYGTEAPDENTIGRIYLQHYDSEPEVDYIVEAGINDGWHYQKWHSGIAKCFKSFEFTTTVQTVLGGSAFYQNSTAMKQLDYPFHFTEVPSETYSIQSQGGLVWLAAAKDGANTKEKTAAYTIISTDKLNNATYKISLQIAGTWR